MNLEFHPAVQRDVNEITAYYEREARVEREMSTASATRR
jgi:RIO-like serine/threonine protein kinase